MLVRDGATWTRRVKVTKAKCGSNTLRLHWISQDWGLYTGLDTVSSSLISQDWGLYTTLDTVSSSLMSQDWGLCTALDTVSTSLISRDCVLVTDQLGLGSVYCTNYGVKTLV